MKFLNGLHVYWYQHDDDQRGWSRIEHFSYKDSSTGSDERPSATFIEKLKSALKQCGWEGDGELGAMMVPPFFSSEGDNYWFPIFHVKQGHRGTSWIVSERPLGIENLHPASD